MSISDEIYNRAEQTGYDRGYDEGYQEGFDAGFDEALERYRLVLLTLLEDMQND